MAPSLAPSLASPPSPCYVCEYLPRVATTTVIADPAIASVKRRQLTITVEDTNGNSYPLVLPTSLPVTNVMAKGNGIALTMAQDPQASGPTNFVADTVKWSVSDLARKAPKGDDGHTYDFSFRCHGCHTTVIDSRDYKFHEMPLEYWYELMDVWHCHKPENHQETTKTYADIKPHSASEILVGLYYFLLMPSLYNPRLIYTDNDHWQCHHCHADLGEKKINKWQVELAYGDHVEIYTKTEYWYLAIMDKVNMAVRKFVVGNYLVWVANVDVGATIATHAYRHCLKLMYRLHQENDNDDVVELEHKDELFAQLQTVTEALPPQCRTLGDWTVSYLPLLTS